MRGYQQKRRMTLSNFSVKFYFLFFLAIFCSLVLFSSGSIDSEDGWLYLNVARNIYYQHEILATPQTDYPIHNVNMNSMKGSDGKWHTPGSIGYSFAMVPAVALSDLFHHYYNSPPAPYFPLNSDWTLLFFASFTNCFFASLLAVIMLQYAITLDFSKRSAVLLSLITIFASNLLPMSKFSFPQMMFTACLMLTFLAIKKRHPIGIASFGLMVISYNISYALAVPALLIYFLYTENRVSRKKHLRLLIGGFLLLLLIKGKFLFDVFSGFLKAPKVIFEGLWGFFFSSGKSIFLYSPILLILPLFWHKLNKKYTPEIVSFTILTFTFLVLVSSAWIGNPLSKAPIWYGGMVWGPRYSTPVLPGLLILTFLIVTRLSRRQKRFIVIPLICFGVIIQLVGVSASYLLQYSDLPHSIFIGKDELSVYDYTSFIPRYSPLWAQPHTVLHLLTEFPKTILHGKYNVRFYDGFDLPLFAGPNLVFRGFREDGHISFSQDNANHLNTINIALENVPDTIISSESAILTISSQDHLIQKITLPIEKDVNLTIDPSKLTALGGRILLDLSTTYAATPSAPHVIYIKNFTVNQSNINLGTLDYPDVSTIGTKITPIAYQYYGGKITDPWKLWNVRARITERTFDLWWVRNLYYWDRPQRIIWMFFVADVTALVFTVTQCVKCYKREINK